MGRPARDGRSSEPGDEDGHDQSRRPIRHRRRAARNLRVAHHRRTPVRVRHALRRADVRASAAAAGVLPSVHHRRPGESTAVVRPDDADGDPDRTTDVRRERLPVAVRLPSDSPGRSAHVIVPAADGTFTFTNLWVPTRFALVPVVPGWWLKSFQVGDVDAANQTLDFSTGPRVVRDVTAVLARAARITGRVTFDGAATERALVVAFAADPQRWYQDSIYIRLAQ